MKLLHHSQGYSQMYIFIQRNRTPYLRHSGPGGQCSIWACVRSAAQKLGVKRRVEESQPSRTTTFLTPEGAAAPQAQTALLRGAIFYPNRTSHRIARMQQAEMCTASLYLRSQSHIIIIITVFHWYYGSPVAVSICWSQIAVTQLSTECFKCTFLCRRFARQQREGTCAVRMSTWRQQLNPSEKKKEFYKRNADTYLKVVVVYAF